MTTWPTPYPKEESLASLSQTSLVFDGILIEVLSITMTQRGQNNTICFPWHIGEQF